MTAPKPAPAADPQQSASSAQGEQKGADDCCFHCGGSPSHPLNGNHSGMAFVPLEAQAPAHYRRILFLEAQLTQLRAELEEAKEQRLQCGHPATYGFGTYCAICERDSLRSDLALAREALRRVRTDLEDGGAYIVEDGFEEPSQCKQLREVTEALARLTTKEGNK